jgi:hypothetical protein
MKVSLHAVIKSSNKMLETDVEATWRGDGRAVGVTLRVVAGSFR